MSSAERLAALHATAFDKPWDAAAFADLLAAPGVFALEEGEGFILCRTVGDETEILTLAVAPAARRQGLARRLLTKAQEVARLAGTRRLFLEAAVDNAAALRLYQSAGFTEAGLRRGYYARPGGAVDARVLQKALAD